MINKIISLLKNLNKKPTLKRPDSKLLNRVIDNHLYWSKIVYNLKIRWETWRIKYGLFPYFVIMILLMLIITLFFLVIFISNHMGTNIHPINFIVYDASFHKFTSYIIAIGVALWALYKFIYSKRIIIGVDCTVTNKNVYLQFITRTSNPGFAKMSGNMRVSTSDGKKIILPREYNKFGHSISPDPYPNIYLNWFDINRQFSELNRWKLVPGGNIINFMLKNGTNDQRIKNIIFCAQEALYVYNYTEIDINDLSIELYYKLNHKYAEHIQKIPISTIINYTFSDDEKSKLNDIRSDKLN